LVFTSWTLSVCSMCTEILAYTAPEPTYVFKQNEFSVLTIITHEWNFGSESGEHRWLFDLKQTVGELTFMALAVFGSWQSILCTYVTLFTVFKVGISIFEFHFAKASWAWLNARNQTFRLKLANSEAWRKLLERSDSGLRQKASKLKLRKSYAYVIRTSVRITY